MPPNVESENPSGEGETPTSIEILSPYMLAHIHDALPYAERIARSKFLDDVSYDDTLSYAYTGLVELARSFDPDRGVPFVAYVSERLKNRMVDQYRKETHANRATGAPRVISLLTRYSNVVSLHAQDADGRYVYDIAQPPLIEESITRSNSESRLGEVGWALGLIALQPRQAFIDYYVHGDAQRVIANRMGVTDTRVTQLITYTERRIRHLLRVSDEVPRHKIVMDDLIDYMLNKPEPVFVKDSDIAYTEKGEMSSRATTEGLKRGLAEGIFEQPVWDDPDVYVIPPHKFDNMPDFDSTA